MAKRKNLSKEEHEEVDNWVKTTNLQNNEKNKKISMQDIPINISCLNVKQKQLKQLIEEKEIVIARGPAGTGKTYLSLITGLKLLKKDNPYKKLVMIKSIQPIKGENPGFLPGTLKEKMAPYMTSFTGNITKIVGSELITTQLMDNGTIIIEPIAYIRGNTLDNSIIVIDEAQNINLSVFKTIITRIGKNSKMIFLGDDEQIDGSVKNSCLKMMYEAFKESEDVGTLEFENEECVRNPIIPKLLEIISKYE